MKPRLADNLNQPKKKPDYKDFFRVLGLLVVFIIVILIFINL